MKYRYMVRPHRCQCLWKEILLESQWESYCPLSDTSSCLMVRI